MAGTRTTITTGTTIAIITTTSNADRGWAVFGDFVRATRTERPRVGRTAPHGQTGQWVGAHARFAALGTGGAGQPDSNAPGNAGARLRQGAQAYDRGTGTGNAGTYEQRGKDRNLG
jgi:hypothetical protein